MRHGAIKTRCRIQYAQRYLFLLLILAWSAQESEALDLIGYLPYYRMNGSYNTGTLPTQLGMLNEVRYFGLTAASDGSIVPLAGSGTMQSHLNNIALIKQKIEAMPVGQRPRLDITLGGAGEDASFTNIARTVSSVPCTLCTTFAQNIKSLLDSTGATAVDIDWEHPDAGVERSTSYPDMLKRIKHEVGAARRVYAVVDPTVVISNGVLSGTDAIDGISLMTYDLGWWGNDPANPFQGEHSLPQYVIDSADAWTQPAGSPNHRTYVFGTWGNNVPAGQLGVGLPFYAHAVTGADATPTYSQLVASGSTADTNYFTYQGQSVWLPGPSLAEQRVQFAKDRGLQHMIIWELGQDLPPNNPYSLLYRAYLKNLGLAPLAGDYDADRDVDAADYAIWRTMFGQTGYGKAADSNGNQLVDAGDYVSWRKTVTALGSGSVANLTVPEPSCMWLLVCLSYLAISGCNSRRRRL
jgi:GH18 family chitinase